MTGWLKQEGHRTGCSKCDYVKRVSQDYLVLTTIYYDRQDAVAVVGLPACRGRGSYSGPFNDSAAFMLELFWNIHGIIIGFGRVAFVPRSVPRFLMETFLSF
jgi:hypothetical protein